MLRLPLTSVLLATVLMGTDGLTITPQVVVAVVVAFVVTAVLPASGPPQAGVSARPAAPDAGSARATDPSTGASPG
jgi:hypothetical protein